VVTALGRGDGTPEAIIMYYNCTVFLSVPRRTVAEGSTNKQTRRNNRTALIPWHVRGRHVSPRTNTQDIAWRLLGPLGFLSWAPPGQTRGRGTP
jgi:hypothetical protein